MDDVTLLGVAHPHVKGITFTAARASVKQAWDWFRFVAARAAQADDGRHASRPR